MDDSKPGHPERARNTVAEFTKIIPGGGYKTPGQGKELVRGEGGYEYHWSGIIGMVCPSSHSLVSVAQLMSHDRPPIQHRLLDLYQVLKDSTSSQGSVATVWPESSTVLPTSLLLSWMETRLGNLTFPMLTRFHRNVSQSSKRSLRRRGRIVRMLGQSLPSW